MNDLVLPLILLWAVNRSSSPTTMSRASAPPWPTPNSPPPPMPAFEALPTPSADPSHVSTPLADLHNAPPELAPASSAQPGATKARSVPEQIKQNAIQAFKKKATQQLKNRARASAAKTAAPNLSTLLSPAKTATTVSVASLQKILNQRGMRVVQDGLYGPKTASAWSKLANSKHLTPTITRVGPKIAKVVTHTYDSLSTPAIP